MGIEMYIVILFFASWISRKWKRRIIGFGLMTDISVHLFLQTTFGGDAEGRAGLLLAGVLVNITMHAYRHFLGYEKLTAKGWITQKGKWV
jgi:hypothetical protein